MKNSSLSILITPSILPTKAFSISRKLQRHISRYFSLSRIQFFHERLKDAYTNEQQNKKIKSVGMQQKVAARSLHFFVTAQGRYKNVYRTGNSSGLQCQRLVAACFSLFLFFPNRKQNDLVTDNPREANSDSDNSDGDDYELVNDSNQEASSASCFASANGIKQVTKFVSVFFNLPLSSLR